MDQRIYRWLKCNFKMYNASASTEQLKDGSSFLPSLSITYNYFWNTTSANKYFFLRSGIVARGVNSLVDLQTFDYSKETVINVTSTEQLKSSKAGTAYNGDLKHGYGFEVPIEVYWAPWTQQAIPGLYVKTQYSFGEAWINKNKVSIDLGIVWNVINNEKDSKNVLTIVPFMNWSNILKDYKNAGKTEEKPLSDLFSVGVKFGIPINLGR